MVLGTAQYDGVPSRQFAARLDHAVGLWEAGVAKRVYTLGGKLPGDRFTEAQVGRDYLAERGVPATAVPEGNDTVGSYRALVDKHEPGRVIIVTDPNHALRAELSLARLQARTGNAAALGRLERLASLSATDIERRRIAWLARAYLSERTCHGPQREQVLQQLSGLDLSLQQAQPEGGAMVREVDAIREGCQPAP